MNDYNEYKENYTKNWCNSQDHQFSAGFTAEFQVLCLGIAE